MVGALVSSGCLGEIDVATPVDAGPSALSGTYAFTTVDYMFHETSPGDSWRSDVEPDRVTISTGYSGLLLVHRSAVGCTLRADRVSDTSARLESGQTCQIGVTGALYTLTLTTGTVNIEGVTLSAEYHWTYVLDLGGGMTRRGTLTEAGQGSRQ